MRNLKQTYDSLVSKNEKEWDAKLFIDSAVKNDTEHKLEIIARALSGRYKISINSKDAPYSNTMHHSGDCGNWVKSTTKHKYFAQLQSEDSGYIFYGNNKTQLYLQIIDFWAGKESIFPCGGSQHTTITRD